MTLSAASPIDLRARLMRDVPGLYSQT